MIAIKIDDAAVKRALRDAPGEIARALSEEVAIWTRNGVTEWGKSALRAPDDRNAADFLLRRPVASKGLRRVTGALATDYYFEAPVVTKISDLVAKTGWRAGLKARIARVHELGTVGHGGKLPDIVPRRASHLAIPIRGAGASRGTKVGRVVKVKKVRIPPRLGFIAYWTGPAKLEELRKRIKAGADRALRRAAKRRA